jgi:hypothetical protein
MSQQNQHISPEKLKVIEVNTLANTLSEANSRRPTLAAPSTSQQS